MFEPFSKKELDSDSVGVWNFSKIVVGMAKLSFLYIPNSYIPKRDEDTVTGGPPSHSECWEFYISPKHQLCCSLGNLKPISLESLAAALFGLPMIFKSRSCKLPILSKRCISFVNSWVDFHWISLSSKNWRLIYQFENSKCWLLSFF